MKNTIKAASVSLIVLSSALFAQAADAAQKIGFINTAQVFQALPQREVVLQQMQEEFKDKAAELQSLQAQAKTMIERLRRDSELMSQDDVDKLRIEIGQLDSTYKIKAQALEQASARREAEEKQRLFKIIQDAVQKVAEKEGYDIIVDVSAMQYGKAQYNISEKVIQAIK
ncbi:OmpH family outer membrane protein [Vibrio cincinnatiensis]|uniref:OmpH family outer membrane protein n=1 Tax=Vibrio cincinnatiensis TaxID=675 RepID=UPI00099B421B|nr:OmpH family outer membrane protein [Vibrio cincinnatiensis]MCG3722739.1 molecular chaperone [Vibrio cincinnatiensis]MCG3726115.1 molecular chaperone [Vibrio cincinnatiensis]MCG3732639.1 molecular chaperone [Vibrio cincinnatiensis]MCG3736154.1 molecular chaperone [Vibrio cincinnatiensis]MCG3738626.1 molecular chaperone [Vibrio cincinnatiensis]